jgi:hypothetical protein
VPVELTAIGCRCPEASPFNFGIPIEATSVKTMIAPTSVPATKLHPDDLLPSDGFIADSFLA